MYWPGGEGGSHYPNLHFDLSKRSYSCITVAFLVSAIIKWKFIPHNSEMFQNIFQNIGSVCTSDFPVASCEKWVMNPIEQLVVKQLQKHRNLQKSHVQMGLQMYRTIIIKFQADLTIGVSWNIERTRRRWKRRNYIYYIISLCLPRLKILIFQVGILTFLLYLKCF